MSKQSNFYFSTLEGGWGGQGLLVLQN